MIVEELDDELPDGTLVLVLVVAVVVLFEDVEDGAFCWTK